MALNTLFSIYSYIFICGLCVRAFYISQYRRDELNAADTVSIFEILLQFFNEFLCVTLHVKCLPTYQYVM